MASFAYIKELFEKKDKNGNGYLDLLVIGSDKKEYPAKVWQFDNNGQFEKDDVVEIEYTLDNYRGKNQLTITSIKKSAERYDEGICSCKRTRRQGSICNAP